MRVGAHHKSMSQSARLSHGGSEGSGLDNPGHSSRRSGSARGVRPIPPPSPSPIRQRPLIKPFLGPESRASRGTHVEGDEEHDYYRNEKALYGIEKRRGQESGRDNVDTQYDSTSRSRLDSLLHEEDSASAAVKELSQELEKREKELAEFRKKLSEQKEQATRHRLTRLQEAVLSTEQRSAKLRERRVRSGQNEK